MKTGAILFLLLSPLSQALGIPPLIASRQTPQARITNVFASGTGCPSGSFSSTIGVRGQDAVLSYNRFNASIGGTGPRPLLACSIRLDVTIPSGCTTLDVVARYGGFGRFGRTVAALQTNTYSVTTGDLTENNDRFEFRGTEFADGEATLEEDEIRIVTTVPREQNTRFTINIEDEVRQAGTTAEGFYQVQVSTFNIVGQTRCW